MKLHTTEPYPCSYLPDRSARSQIAVPDHCPVKTSVYAQLIQEGFRRSGYFVYRPNCDHCTACVPVRIVVDQFKPNRSQNRAWKHHHTLRVSVHKLHFHPDHFRLYRRYQQKRHALSEMSCDTHDQYCEFLLQSSIDSVLVTFHEGNQLKMVSIIDQLPDGLSSVYTFFDPDEPQASFGTFSILWQIQFCQLEKYPYLYLGYWIKESRKMNYKAHFQPLEYFRQGEWTTFAEPILEKRSTC